MDPHMDGYEFLPNVKYVTGIEFFCTLSLLFENGKILYYNFTQLHPLSYIFNIVIILLFIGNFDRYYRFRMLYLYDAYFTLLEWVFANNIELCLFYTINILMYENIFNIFSIKFTFIVGTIIFGLKLFTVSQIMYYSTLQNITFNNMFDEYFIWLITPDKYIIPDIIS